MGVDSPPTQSWPRFLENTSIFSIAIRHRNLIWTIQKYFPNGGRFLETGFGSGATSLLVADLDYRVVAVDISEELVERARTRYADWIRTKKVEFRQEDMLTLPWKKQEFDLAYHQGVLEHFSDNDIVRALREQARVAEWVIFDVPNHRYGEQPFGDERLLHPRRWKRMIHEGGLHLVEVRGRGYHPWMYFLPYALFSHTALDRCPWFTRWFGICSIFVCRSMKSDR